MLKLGKIIITGWLTALLSFAVFGQSFNEGLEAEKRGDYATAVEIWRPFAEQGHAIAQYNLAIMYQNGEGVPQDPSRAASWYRRAAEQGDSMAQSNLGSIYRQGRGVPQNYAEATSWYRRAAEQGDIKAQHNLAIMYWEGKGVTRNPVMAYVLQILAAAEGHEGARHNREITLKMLSHEQVTEAQRMATEWRIGTSLPYYDDFTTWP